MFAMCKKKEDLFVISDRFDIGEINIRYCHACTIFEDLAN